MDALRTPDQQFIDLPDYPFKPHYLDVGGLRLHYVDEGPAGVAPVVLLHGEPTWSYLYRKIIPIFAGAGHRVLAPDLIGFGRSDKPTKITDHSYGRHVEWIRYWLHALDLNRVTLFVQDWGSLIGLRIAAQEPERFARICVANGFLPTADRPVPVAFRIWSALAKASPWFPVGRIVAAGCTGGLSPAVRRAYDAPFPSNDFMAGPRAMPGLVPVGPGDYEAAVNRDAWLSLRKWGKPLLTLFGSQDPILGWADEVLQRDIPGAAGQPHRRLRGGHFVQEDCGEELAALVLDWLS